MTMRKLLLPTMLASAWLLGGCASAPMGPTVTVMPAPGMPLEQFQSIDATCRAFAQQQTAGYTHSATQSGAVSGAAGALLGAAAGALIGGNQNGAAVGAGVGLLAGSAGGAGNYNSEQMTAQQAYNVAYKQCMYSKGAQVPGYAAPRYTPAPSYAPPPSYAPAPSYAPPPPPAGYPPPAPPSYQESR